MKRRGAIGDEWLHFLIATSGLLRIALSAYVSPFFEFTTSLTRPKVPTPRMAKCRSESMAILG